MKKDKITIILFSIFAVIGIMTMIGGGVWLAHNLEFKQEAASVRARIVDIESYRDSDGDYHHTTYVTYTYDDIEYEGVRLGEYSSSMYEGKELEILCDPRNPGHIMSAQGVYMGAGILLFMGLIFLLVGLIPLLVILKRKKKSQDLLTTGHVLHAVVDEITWNMNYRVNGQNPYIIYCSYKDEYKDVIYRFKSENLWTDPSLVFQPGSNIDVYVDQNDYSNYYVNAKAIIEQKVVDYTI